jgi:Leucine-rich repeat (LRR) protein
MLAAELTAKDEQIAALRTQVEQLQRRVRERSSDLEGSHDALKQSVWAKEVAALETATRDPRLAGAACWLARLLPEKFARLTPEEARYIRDLDLRGLEIAAQDLQHLEALPNLRSVELRGSAISDEALAPLQRLAELKRLGLRGTKVTGASIGSLPAGLESLDLTDTQVGEEALFRLPGLHSLATLDLNRLPLGDSAVEALGSRPSLRHIELDGTSITDAGLTRLLRLNPNLQRIEVRSTKASASVAAALAEAHPGLTIVLGDPFPLATGH